MVYKRKTPKPETASAKKSNPNPKQSQNDAGGSGELSEPEVVETNIETHNLPAASGSLIDRAKNKLSEIGQESIDSNFVEESKPKSNWRKYSQKAKQNQSKAEFATLVSTVIILLVAIWPAPDSVKPERLEVDAVSEHLAGIVLRHIDLSGAITADVLDVIGIVAVIGAYLTRVGPELRQLARRGSKPSLSSKDTIVDTGNGFGEVEPSETPIGKLAPEVKDYLDKIAGEDDNSNSG